MPHYIWTTLSDLWFYFAENKDRISCNSLVPVLSTGPGSQEVFHIRFLNGKINTMLIQAELKLGERLLILPSVLPLSRRNLHPSEVPDQTQQRIILLSEPQAQSLPLAPAPSVRSELRKYVSSSTTFSLAQKLH